MLVPCASCARHVRATDPACPFCGATIDAASPRALPTQRLGRAATFAFGAAIATSALGCGTATTPDSGGLDAAYGGPPHDAAAAPDTFVAPDAGVFPPYGAPPEDGGPADDSDSPADTGSPADAAPDTGNLAGAYGGPPIDGGNP